MDLEDLLLIPFRLFRKAIESHYEAYERQRQQAAEWGRGFVEWEYWRNSEDGLAVLGELLLDLCLDAAGEVNFSTVWDSVPPSPADPSPAEDPEAATRV